MSPNFLKKYRIVVLLHQSIRDKVEHKDPGTYNETIKVAKEKWRKKVRRHEMENREREANIHQRDGYVPMNNVLEPLPLDTHVEREIHVEAPESGQ
ncbi:hypothetical protein GOP47_0031206 [Adiantum capillus-veneris]|nr:hypothetical protein GOP47_0031204 [Adiantum capillus-veneris]KAI5053904.1 hypothetical protein GOP47_0031206 [Adiantum capillus-veneris]